MFGKSKFWLPLNAYFLATGAKHVGGSMAGRQGAQAARGIAGQVRAPGMVKAFFDRSELEQLVKIGQVLKEQQKVAAPPVEIDWNQVYADFDPDQQRQFVNLAEKLDTERYRTRTMSEQLDETRRQMAAQREAHEARMNTQARKMEAQRLLNERKVLGLREKADQQLAEERARFRSMLSQEKERNLSGGREVSKKISRLERQLENLRALPQKESVLAKMLKHPIRTGIPLAGALALGGATTALGVHAVGQILGRTTEVAHLATRKRQFNKMLRADPTLKTEPQARQLFDVLHKTSPFLAGDPILGAATVRNMIAQGTMVEGGVPNVHPELVKRILEVQRGRAETRFPHIQRAIGSAAGGPTGWAGAEI
jgi:hypothetical protein